MRGITQVKLAQQLGVSKQSVSNWENNNIQPSIELLEKLADCFSVSTDMLLGRETGVHLDATGLTEDQLTHLRFLVEDLRRANKSAQASPPPSQPHPEK